MSNQLIICSGCGKGVAINPTKHQYSVKYCPWCRTVIVSTHKIYSGNPWWLDQKNLQDAARKLLKRGAAFIGDMPSPLVFMEYAQAAFMTAVTTAAVYAKLKKRPTHEDIEKGRTRR